MIKLITGKKGSGKTKIIIDRINTAEKESTGCLVCVEKGVTLRREISNNIRWCGVEEYKIAGSDSFYGFIAGLVAGNYDIQQIFVDGILKIVGPDFEELGALLDKLNNLTGANVTVTFTISADNSELPESVKKFLD